MARPVFDIPVWRGQVSELIPDPPFADRSLRVPAGSTVRTAWVPIDAIRFGCRERMAVGDVERAYRAVLQREGSAGWPPPNGSWDGDRFVIADGRHEVIAHLMLGWTHVFVAWVDRPEGS